MTNIFEYNDYRVYILDTLSEKNITASFVAQKLGLKSKSYLGLILRGQKRLQSEQIHPFKDLFTMSAPEFEYFFHLVFYTDAEGTSARAYHKRKREILRKGQRTNAQTVHAKEEILAHWYYPALLLYNTLTKKLPLKTLSTSLGISVEALKQANDDLEKLGLLKSDDSAAGPRLKIAKKSWNQIQRRFLKSQIKNAFDSFDKNYEKHGKYYSQTITFKQESFEEVWNIIKAKMDALAERSDAEPAEELLQLNVQFYKLV